MNCRDHDRAHCAEPRCHVLAVCAAQVPTETELSPQAFVDAYGYRAWLRARHFVEGRDSIGFGEPIAARLVTWIRWHGQRRAGCMAQARYAVPPHPVIDTKAWIDQGPGIYHPLDAIATHEQRVSLLVSACDRNHQSMSVREQSRHMGAWDCGLNWQFVAVVCDWLEENGAWLEVHAFRDDKKYPWHDAHTRVVERRAIPATQEVSATCTCSCGASVERTVSFQRLAANSESWLVEWLGGILDQHCLPLMGVDRNAEPRTELMSSRVSLAEEYSEFGSTPLDWLRFVRPDDV